MSGESANSVRTNSRLPVGCTEQGNNSVSVDRPQSNINVPVACCSPWQSGMSNNERQETAVKSAPNLDTEISLHATDGPVRPCGSSPPEMPVFASCTGTGEIISLRSERFSSDHRNVVESRLSSDGHVDTMVDASPDQSNTSSQSGCVSALILL